MSPRTDWVQNTVLASTNLLLFLLFPHVLLSKPSYDSLFLSLASNASAAAHLRSLTARPHHSSSPADASAASYVASVLSSASIPSRSVAYDVYLSFPLRRSLTLIANPPAGPTETRFPLVQEIYPGDPYADVAAEALPTFHAYAFSGSAAGPAVYANYGRVEDFARLKKMGVRVNGSVVVARYGEIYRGDIVRNAEDAGAAAAVVYTDSKDYGGPQLFPEGPAMPRSGVQVGSTFRGVGDPTTPGWPSAHAGGMCERLSKEEVDGSGLVPRIPSLPVSARDGEAILAAVGGQVADGEWQGGGKGLVYRVGPGPAVLNVSYEGNETIATIQNVIAVIEGREEPDRYNYVFL